MMNSSNHIFKTLKETEANVIPAIFGQYIGFHPFIK